MRNLFISRLDKISTTYNTYVSGKTGFLAFIFGFEVVLVTTASTIFHWHAFTSISQEGVPVNYS